MGDEGKESKSEEVDAADDDDEKSLFFVDHKGEGDDVSCQVSDLILPIDMQAFRATNTKAAHSRKCKMSHDPNPPPSPTPSLIIFTAC